MIQSLLDLETKSLKALAEAAGRGDLDKPSTLKIKDYVYAGSVAQLATELKQAMAKGLTGPGLTMLLETLVAERNRQETLAVQPSLVWSGPDLDGDHSRETRIVVHELFRKARKRVLVSTYALKQGKDLFQPLHETMTAHPDLKVTLFVDFPRHKQTEPVPALLKKYKEGFKDHWPWGPPPEVYYDPRSLVEQGTGKRGCLHAKVVVVDGAEVFLTSANLTEAAQQRNIEAGVVFRSKAMATRLTSHFEGLVKQGHLIRM